MPTAPTPPPTLDALPEAPSRQAPSTFRALMDAFLAAMVTYRTQLVALATWKESTAQEVHDNASEADASATAAAASSSAASGFADDASGSAGDAANRVTEAENARDLAQTYAAAAGAAAGAGALTGNANKPFVVNSAEDGIDFGGLIELDSGIREKATQLSSSGTVDINSGNGGIQYHTYTAAVTYTDGLVNGESVALNFDDGTGFSPTWPTITWLTADSTAPAVNDTGYNVIVLSKFNSVLYGYPVRVG